MYKQYLLSFVVIFVCNLCYGQSEHSNALFAQGVELYRSDKFAEAIPIFKEIIQLDTLDDKVPTSRRNYGLMWLSSCYYKLGRLAEAEATDHIYFDISPIDRRLTVASDSMSEDFQRLYAAGNFQEALLLGRRIMNLEIDELGGETVWSFGTKSGIIELLALTGKKAEAQQSLQELIDTCVVKYGPSVRYLELPLKLFIKLSDYWGDADAVDKGFEVLHNYYVKSGQGDSDDCYAQLDNWANVCMQIGRMERYDLVHQMREERQTRRYGAKSEEIAFLTMCAANDNLTMRRWDLALSQAIIAEKLGMELNGRGSSPRLLSLVVQANIYMARQDFKTAKRLLRGVLKDMKENNGDLTELAPMLTNALLLVQANEGKTDRSLLAESEEILDLMAQKKGMNNKDYSQTCLSLAVPMAMSGEAQRAASKILPIQDFLIANRDFSKLYQSGFVFLLAEKYVNARKAYSNGLSILNEELSQKYAAQAVAANRASIEIGLNYINNLSAEKGSIGLSRDTTSYALSLIKQNLLQAKLLMLVHNDSLGSEPFMQTLSEYADVSINKTGDELMADSIVGYYANLLKEQFGLDSSVYEVALQMLEGLKSNNVSHGEKTDHVELPMPRSLWMILNDHSFQKDYEYSDSVYHVYCNIANQYGVKRISANYLADVILGWAMCADSLGRRDEVAPRLLECQRLFNEIVDDPLNDISITMIMIAWMHCSKEDFIQVSDKLMEKRDDNPSLVFCSAMLKAMYMISDIGYRLPDKTLGSRVLNQMNDWLQVVQMQDEDNGMTYRKLFILKTMAVWCHYWDFGIKDRNSLKQDFLQILEWLEKTSVLQPFEQCYEAMNMLCDIAGDYRVTDYQLVIRADQMRKRVKRLCIAAMDEQNKEYARMGLFINASWPSMSPIGESFKLYIRNDSYYSSMDDLEHHIQYAYAMNEVPPNALTKDTYDNLVAAWDEVRIDQRNAYIREEELQKKMDKLNAEAYNALYNGSDSISRIVYDITLFSKGYMLRSDQKLAKVIEQSGNMTVLRKFRDYLDIKRQLDNTSLPSTDIETLKSKAQSMWWELKGLSKAFDDYTRELEASWKDVRDALDEDEVAIEYVAPSSDYGNYYALVLRKGYEAPKVFRSCSDWTINHYGDSIYFDKYNGIWPSNISAGGSTIYPLQGVHNIYVSPSGILHRVGIECLRDLYSDSLMCEKYNIFRLSNTREIIHQKPSCRQMGSNDRAALFGGIEYYLDTDTWKLMASTKSSDNKNIAMRDEPRLSRGAIGVDIAPLEGTREEVVQIADIFKRSLIPVETYMDREATEERVKGFSGSNITLLHIATHGFYQTAGTATDSTTVSFSRADDTREEDALSRTGLFFAGAAAVFDETPIPDNLEDGVLTARELSHLDYTNMNLVVLSACETGLGDITGDGVFGLQRGFKKAGANSILMSLWKVDDEATCLLMTEFYKNWIGEGKTKHDALEQAKQSVRSHKEKGWDDPKYWAAFILLDALD